MKTTVLSVFALLFPFIIWAQSKVVNESDTLAHSSAIEAVSDTIPNLNIFDNDIPMDLTLKYDITSFIRNKMKGEYLDAELHVKYKDYEASKNIRLKARGNNRRQTCFFPPIYLNFKTNPIQHSELAGIKKIKLVTHCSTSKSYTNYILKEFLIYKLYNLISEQSFRVKLINLKYIDTGKKERNYEKFGFLIEPVELLTKRTNSVEVEASVINKDDIIAEEADVLALFQYMIGNTDWRTKAGHNTKFIKSLTKISAQVSPVPYDFDYSGFVGTHYSFPQTWTSIESVQEREYLGYCRDNDEAYLKAVSVFQSKKSEIIKTIESFNYLPEKEREDVLDYVASFYELIEQPEKFIRIMKAECRADDF